MIYLNIFLLKAQPFPFSEIYIAFYKSNVKIIIRKKLNPCKFHLIIKNRENVLKQKAHSPCLFINDQILALFYPCLFCKKFFCIFLNIRHLFCSQIHKIAVIHRAIRILYIHHLSIFLSNRIEPYFLWYIVNFTLLH